MLGLALTDLAKELGIAVKQLAFIVRKAKKLHREEKFPESEFKGINVVDPLAMSNGPWLRVEIVWDNGTLIRFQQVEQLGYVCRADKKVKADQSVGRDEKMN